MGVEVFWKDANGNELDRALDSSDHFARAIVEAQQARRTDLPLVTSIDVYPPTEPHMHRADVTGPVRAGGWWLRIIAVAILLAGCPGGGGPAGFWKRYHPEAIASQRSDQGPWGGERWIAWRAERPGTFTLDRARTFAEKNGWKLHSTRRHDTHASPPPPTSRAEPRAPRFLPKPSTIAVFETGWIREDPGTNQTSASFGYVQVSDDGREMYVYHFWGNG